VPDVLASTANLLHVSGFKGSQPYGEGTPNFEAMREWNRATIYRKTIGYFADRLAER
jgi:membrane-bound lytic murein transglycosylase B